MAYTRTTAKAKNAIRDRRYSEAIQRANLAFKKPEYIEDENGFRVRVWGDGSFDYVKDEDVRAWLVGNRVIEDLRSGLEFVRESYIRKLVAEGYLRRSGPLYWVTQKAADRFRLPPVMGCEFST